MKATDIFKTLSLPAEARVDKRVPKKLLLENGAQTASDKRAIKEGIEELRWWAVLKPNTVGVPEYGDSEREYLEIAVLSLNLRPAAKVSRLTVILHRAIPYPILLITELSDVLEMSLGHKRWAQNEMNKVVLDGEVISIGLTDNPQMAQMNTDITEQFLKSIAIGNLTKTNLFDLYQGLVDRVHALQAARITGKFNLLTTKDAIKKRQEALLEYDSLTSKIAALRSQAENDSQINRRVDLNIEIKHLESVLAGIKSRL